MPAEAVLTNAERAYIKVVQGVNGQIGHTIQSVGYWHESSIAVKEHKMTEVEYRGRKHKNKQVQPGPVTSVCTQFECQQYRPEQANEHGHRCKEESFHLCKGSSFESHFTLFYRDFMILHMFCENMKASCVNMKCRSCNL